MATKATPKKASTKQQPCPNCTGIGARHDEGCPRANDTYVPPGSTPVARAASPQPEALDAAALGARVARRSASRLVRRPGFWAILLLVAAGVAYLLLQRSSSGP